MSLLKSVHTVARLMVCSFFALPLFAWSNNSIATDRPDFVESSDVVGQGRVQIETGFSEERDRSGGVKTKIRTTPTLIRIGVSDTLELRRNGRLRPEHRRAFSGRSNLAGTRLF